MTEPPPLRAARQHLSQAEAHHRSEDGLYYLAEGLALLEEVEAAASLHIGRSLQPRGDPMLRASASGACFSVARLGRSASFPR